MIISDNELRYLREINKQIEFVFMANDDINNELSKNIHDEERIISIMDNKVMYDFYKMSYEFKYLEKSDLQEACKWDCISKEQYKEIVKEDYKE